MAVGVDNRVDGRIVPLANFLNHQRAALYAAGVEYDEACFRAKHNCVGKRFHHRDAVADFGQLVVDTIYRLINAP